MSKNPRKTPRSKETPDPEQDQPEGDLPEVSVELEPDDPEAPEWWTSGLIPLPDDLATDCEAARAVGGIRKTKFTFEEWDRIGTVVVAIRRFADERIEASQGNRNTFQHILRQEGIAELIAAPKQENYLYATCTRLLAQQAKKAEVLAWRDQLTPEQREAWQSPHSVERHCPALGGTFVKYAPNTANVSDPNQITDGDGQRYDDLPPLPDDDDEEDDDWGDDIVEVCRHCTALNRIPAGKDLADASCGSCHKPLVEPEEVKPKGKVARLNDLIERLNQQVVQLKEENKKYLHRIEQLQAFIAANALTVPEIDVGDEQAKPKPWWWGKKPSDFPVPDDMRREARTDGIDDAEFDKMNAEAIAAKRADAADMWAEGHTEEEIEKTLCLAHWKEPNQENDASLRKRKQEKQRAKAKRLKAKTVAELRALNSDDWTEEDLKDYAEACADDAVTAAEMRAEGYTDEQIDEAIGTFWRVDNTEPEPPPKKKSRRKPPNA